MKLCKYLLLPACALLLSSARADIKTTQEMKAGGKLFSRTTRYVREGAERLETTMMLPGMEHKSIMITLCDKRQLLTLAPDLKMYTVTPLVEPGAPVKAPTAGGEKKTGKMTMTLVSIKEMGEETIGEHKTRCYLVTTRMQTSGCLGDSDMTTRQMMCIESGDADGGGGGGCSLVSDPNAGGGNDCQTTTERKGDWAAYEKLTRGLQVRSRILGDEDDKDEKDDTPQSETTLTMVSRAKLGDEWFSVPEGFKQVTEAEMQAAQAKAMMEKMQAGAGAGAAAQDAEEN